MRSFRFCTIMIYIYIYIYKLHSFIKGLLAKFNTKLSPKMYWQHPRSKEVGEEGDYT